MCRASSFATVLSILTSLLVACSSSSGPLTVPCICDGIVAPVSLGSMCSGKVYLPVTAGDGYVICDDNVWQYTTDDPTMYGYSLASTDAGAPTAKDATGGG